MSSRGTSPEEARGLVEEEVDCSLVQQPNWPEDGRARNWPWHSEMCVQTPLVLKGLNPHSQAPGTLSLRMHQK